MEKQSPSISKSAMTYGLYLGLAVIVFNLILYVTGQIENQALGWLTLAMQIGIMCWAMINYRDKENNGVLKYGEGVGLGTLTMLFGGILSSIFTFILYKYVEPGIVDGIVDQALEKSIQKGVSESELEMVEKLTRMFTNPTAILIMEIFGSAFIGAIISLILAAIFKKEPSIFDSPEAEQY